MQSPSAGEAAQAQAQKALGQLPIQFGIALAIMTALSVALAWRLAGRVLRPLRTMTETAGEISASSLDRRLALQGPEDEVKRLGEAFDGLLARLEASFEAQRRFVANASHELRTPLTYERTLLEVALADPDPSAESLREVCEQLLVSEGRQERLIDALLTLARGQAGLQRREPFDLASVSEAVLLARKADVESLGLEVHTALAPAWATGDPRLVERLVANLIDNAIRHNADHGSLHVTTATLDGQALLRIANTGPTVSSEDVEQLFEPFRTADADRTRLDDGHGLGLSIVRAVADAHGAVLDAEPQPGGGLRVEVRFPAGESVRPSGEPARTAHIAADGLEPAEEVAQSRRVGVERRPTPVGQRHRGLRPDAVAGLHGDDVAGLLELAQVRDEVAGREGEHLL